jgi:DNA-binding transcriptional MerR regulator
MRMAELSRRTGVPVPTIKYYLREGLLQPGERTSPNQARYDEPHVHRLKMIRALVEVAGLSIAVVRDVLEAAETDLVPHQVLGEVQERLPPATPGGEGEAWETAYDLVVDLIERRGWNADPDCAPGRALTTAIRSLYEMGRADLVGLIEVYADGVEKMAEADVRAVIRGRGMEDVIEGVVLGTVIGDTLISSLRRLAHQHASDEFLRERE